MRDVRFTLQYTFRNYAMLMPYIEHKCFEEKYVYGETPTRQQLEDALQVLKCERYARWQSMMTDQEREEIEQAHYLCMYLLRETLTEYSC